ncbi:MAG TPA: aspartate ammonia-lyase [Gammaproteobacteria bacterium]|nr:aspartate ammonia-lyase [Gammaproteobacteria bacterium]
MEIKQIADFFNNVELFQELDDQERLRVAELTETKALNLNVTLFRENNPRRYIFIIYQGEVQLFKRTATGEEKRLVIFDKKDFLGENVLVDDTPYSTSARTLGAATVLRLDAHKLKEAPDKYLGIMVKMIRRTTKVMVRRMIAASGHVESVASQYLTGKTRTEHDLLGDKQVRHESYYGIQTLRAIENFDISGVNLSFYPLLIDALAMVKMAAAKANQALGVLPDDIADAIVQACHEILNGKYHNYFAVDMLQGGAGTSTNMNANEVIGNKALQILGYERGEYQYCHPNNHVNLSQSTNDAYPTAVHIALINSNKKLVRVLLDLVGSFRRKAGEFASVIKMGRTQLQDAVPMTLGQEFEAYAVTLEAEVERLTHNANLFLEVNMGATAIGTGINAHPDYSRKVIGHLREGTGLDIIQARNLVEATQDTSAFIMYSSAVKRLAIKLSKICNDLRLLSSGPRAGLNEINLPPMQPGSSIMPGKVNPVIPEVVNQIAFKVIGNDLTVSLAVEAGQLELNVMEPVIVQSLFESIEMLKNGMDTLMRRCIDGISANEDRCRQYVMDSIALVTALNPVLGYEISTQVAKQALETGQGVYAIVLEKGLLSKEELDELLIPENMLRPRKLARK